MLARAKMPKMTSVSITTTVTMGRLMAKSEMVIGRFSGSAVALGPLPAPLGASPHSPNPLSPGLPPDLTGERGLCRRA